MTTHVDFSDYLYVTSPWRKTLLPSHAEMHEYDSDRQQQPRDFHGIIILCPLKCAYQSDICYKDELSHQNWDRLEMLMNGVSIETTATFMESKECGILSHADGVVFPAGDDGTYDLQIRLKADNQSKQKILQISSIVLI